MMIVNKRVKDALIEGKPIVALESTIISHGMPYPKNVETALLVEKTIIDNGSIPATIGIIDGDIIVGMTRDQIELFGKKKGISKVSRRDLPIVTSQKMWGATTVSATMIIASMAGIEVFVTGGIGGVHRGAEKNFDISADLDEMAKSDVTVVCAGAKAILDLPKTLEYLETKGVPVLSYKTDEFADFYTRSSGLKVDYVFNTPQEAALIIKEKRNLKLQGAVLISNPIEKEYAMSKQNIDQAISQALADADKNGVKGKDITPFLLKTIVELTKGKSLEANIHLVVNNAKLGARIAKALVE
ncbi:MAG: pseudouridine-5'-phosphate glycosidase [Bacilli bacterium]|jgi:pseudouridine-5'-phosphate glycosidase